MKKIRLFLLCIICGVFLWGCGEHSEETAFEGAEEAPEDAVEFYDIMVEEERFSESVIDKFKFLGMQFWQGQPIQLWGDIEIDYSSDGTPSLSMELSLYRIDGTWEVLAQGLSAGYLKNYSNWYLDEEGNRYCWGRAGLMIQSPEGEALYKKSAYDEDFYSVSTISQQPDGKLYWRWYVENKFWIGESEPGEAPVPVLDGSKLYPPGSSGIEIGAGRERPGIQRRDGFWEVDIEDESLSEVLLTGGVSYGFPDSSVFQQDFRILEDGSVEVLYCGLDGSKPVYQRLTLEKVEKVPLVIRIEQSTTWLESMVRLFNRTNDTYHAVIETFSPSMEEGPFYASELKDYAMMTSMQLGAGGGPDILCGDGILGADVPSMIEKGIFLDLKPWLEEEGIREEDYFPMAFDSRRDGDGIYGVTLFGQVIMYKADAELLGGEELQSMETLADALLARQGDGVYLTGVDSQELLRIFLEGSENLWGTVDWEKGRCDFTGELFAKLLEASGRYGETDWKKGPILAQDVSLINVGVSIWMGRNTHTVISGVLFDDGRCHGILDKRWGDTISINANSKHLDGVKEFLCLALGEEGQASGGDIKIPVLKTVFDEWSRTRGALRSIAESDPALNPSASGALSSLVDGELVFECWDYYAEDFTEQSFAEYRQIMEEVKTLPLRTEPLLDIICEEAGSYFSGSKNIPETCKVIQNRVQLYLDEHR